MDNNKKVSLKDFIKENYPLLTILGVFGALFSLFYATEFTGPIVSLKPYLQAIIFFIFIIIAFEVWANFPSSKEKIIESRLNLFEQFFIFFVTLVIVFALYSFRDVFKQFFSVILIAIYGSIGNFLIKKFQIYKKVNEFASKYSDFRSTTIRSLFFFIYLGFILILIYLTVILINMYFPNF